MVNRAAKSVDDCSEFFKVVLEIIKLAIQTVSDGVIIRALLDVGAEYISFSRKVL